MLLRFLVLLVFTTVNVALYAPVHEATHCLDYWLNGAEHVCTITLYLPGEGVSNAGGASAPGNDEDWGHAFVYPASLSFTFGGEILVGLWFIQAERLARVKGAP